MTEDESIEYRVLGPIDVILNGEPVTLAPMQRKLLALLLIHVGKVVSNDRIIDALWGERPPGAVGDAVRFHVSRIRRTLVPAPASRARRHVITAGHGGYRLSADAAQIDATRFEQMAREAASLAGEDPDRAVSALEAALALWRGPPYEDTRYEEFAVAEIRRLEAARLRALELRTDLLAHLGRHDDAIDELESLTVDFPTHQGFAEALLESLNRVGRAADALTAYSHVEERFRTELGIDPPETLRRLEAESRALLADPAWTDPEHPRHNVPRPMTTYVERSGEIEALRGRLEKRRLVTLVGPGGVGKTRLATEAVSGMVSEFRDGVWFVDLSPTGDDSEVARVIAGVTGAPAGPRGALDGLLGHLARSEMLIVLDNCEHVAIGCAGVVERLLAACPLVRVLATSREPLGAHGEASLPVDPLGIPASGATLDEARTSPSVRLFVDRAIDAAGYQLTDDDLPAVAALMMRLAGLPLAIEMAAARTRSISPPEITERLNSRLEYLRSEERTTPERHRSLTATFQWSYDLLPTAEQQVFRNLAAHRGSFTLEAAAAVAGRDPSPVFTDAVGELVHASLAVRMGDRYRLLEPIREFAYGLLDSNEELDDTLDRHLGYYEAVAHEQRLAQGSVTGSQLGAHRLDRMTVVDRVGRDLDNYRSALSRALDKRDRHAALEIASGISHYLTGRLAIRENAQFLQAALDLPGDVPGSLLVDALLSLSWTYADLGERDKAEELALEALDVSREIESEADESSALFGLANAAFERGDILLARDRIAACIDACVTIDPTQGSRHTLALIEAFLGNLTAAGRILDELEEGTLDEQAKTYVPRTRGIIAASLADHATALEHFERGAEACPTHRTRIEGLRHVALARLNLGDLTRARTLAAYVHDQTVESDVPEYFARTANLLGIIDVREGRPSLGVAAISASLTGAVSRGNRYRAWSYLHSAAEALAALGSQSNALQLLRFADEIAIEHRYWLPANDWVPLVDRTSLERNLATDGASIESFAAAVEVVRRSAAAVGR